MNNPTLAEIADEVPALVKAGIKGLADDDRLGLALALLDGGRMTFSEIKARFGLNSSTLSSHLTALQKGDLIRNYYEKSEGRAYSYYEATELPKVMLGALFISIGKMKVVENEPIRTREYDPWTNKYGVDTSLSDQQMGGLPEIQAPRSRRRSASRPSRGQIGGVPEIQVATPSKKRLSVPTIFNNTTEETRYGKGVYQLGNNAGRRRATIQGVYNE